MEILSSEHVSSRYNERVLNLLSTSYEKDVELYCSFFIHLIIYIAF